MKTEQIIHKQELFDPVCGMSVTKDSDYYHSYKGDNYYFCSSACHDKFTSEPEKYLQSKLKNKSEHKQSTSHSKPKVDDFHSDETSNINVTLYTCPMHPEIIQDHPGSCPKCGMSLEAKTVASKEKNEELIDMTRRFILSSILAIPVFILAMIADLAPSLLPNGLSMQTVQWIEFALATPVVIWGGWPFFVRAVQSVVTWNLNMFTLIGLGVSVAWTYSMIALLFPGIFPLIMLMEMDWLMFILKRQPLSQPWFCLVKFWN